MKEFEKWFKKAENDLLVIKNNLSANEVPVDACCFHAQQAGEKYLKAYLVSKQINFPKTHDLQSLLNLCIEINSSFKEILEPAIKLSDYAIAPRYPDAFDDLTISDAKNAQRDAIEIKDFILKNFLE
ncbi:MAG: HEPN domain-containing protein [Parafilimonas sp.]|nr:HEPN domain-containing protein [Parafilimonas sp.]